MDGFNERSPVMLRLLGTKSVYLGQVKGEFKCVANTRFALVLSSKDQAADMVRVQHESHGLDFEVVPAPTTSVGSAPSLEGCQFSTANGA